MPIRRLVVAAGLWAAVVGCGGGGQGQPVPVAGFPARFAAGWCALLQRCCQASGGTYDGACETEIQTRVGTMGSQAAADNATWDATVAGRCLAAVTNADCGLADLAGLTQILDTCDDTWTGAVPPGGACQTSGSCAKPAVTGGASAGASCVNSTCVQVVRQPPGAACSMAAASMVLTCDPWSATCTAGTCAALPGAGEACTSTCRTGWHCVAGTCMPQLGLGQACASNAECVSNKCGGGTCASVFAADDDYCTLP